MSLLMHAEGDINAMAEQTAPPFEIVFDSGAVGHVADNAEAPGYAEDARGKSIANFSMVNGEHRASRGDDAEPDDH